MSKEIEKKQALAIDTETKEIQLFTRQPFSMLGKIAFWGFLVTTILCAAIAIVLTIFNGAPSRDIVIVTVLLIITTLLVITRIRWLQALAILPGLYILYLLFVEPFVIESLADPKGPNGGYGHFIGDVVIIATALIAFVANVGMVLQNYHRISRVKPRPFGYAFSIIGGMAVGALFIGAVTPSAPPVSVATLQAPQIPTGKGIPTSINMGMTGASTSVQQLQQAATTAHVDHFTLTAQSAQLTLSPGVIVPAWTFNGTAPGSMLRVRQGDEVEVTLVNHLPFGVTIHWHGVRVPNGADGVAGVTQDAVKPGQSYVYRFTALDAGTYWYHSHQFSFEETTNGLFGALVVDPVTPTLHADVDETVALHTWNGADNQTIYTMNATSGTLTQTARAGQWVRLRIINTAETSSGNPQLLTLMGAPIQVVALDGHDLNRPQWLNETPLPIGTAQRYDIYFQMPAHGQVTLVTNGDNQSYLHAPALVLGQGTVPTKLPAIGQWFDLTSYGSRNGVTSTITSQSHFAATYTIVLGNEMGTSLGRSGMTYTMNGKVFPHTGMIMVKEGQIIKLHFDNQTALYHPMHLHGHVFTVLAQNGKLLTGSPIYQDTVLVPPHATYDVAFLANNPGIWMLHCHNFLHANWGMDMMVMYNVSTPHTVGTASGNFPD